MDLAAAFEFDQETAEGSIQAVRPGMLVFKVSAKSGDGLDELVALLSARHQETRAVASAMVPNCLPRV
jgi:hydrogenase nickel incorporation protein HypB